MNKFLGYILCIVGLLGIAMTSKMLPFNLSILGGFANSTVLIASVALVVVGLLFVIKTGPKKMKEVPIYQGNTVVGYRRQK